MKSEHAFESLKKLSSKEHKKSLTWFFKTGKGEYGEGDVFMGVRMPDIRKVAKTHKDLSLSQVKKLLASDVHEVRMLALVILTLKYEENKKFVYEMYLANTKQINNWDLVDVSAPKIVGAYLFETGKWQTTLKKLAKSDSLWERRIAIVSTLYFIKQGELEPVFMISKMLLKDKHDLIHKAVGWMLREAGKVVQEAEEEFLKENYSNMPRTALRYAIERFPEKKRKLYLKGLF